MQRGEKKLGKRKVAAKNSGGDDIPKCPPSWQGALIPNPRLDPTAFPHNLCELWHAINNSPLPRKKKDIAYVVLLLLIANISYGVRFDKDNNGLGFKRGGLFRTNYLFAKGPFLPLSSLCIQDENCPILIWLLRASIGGYWKVTHIVRMQRYIQVFFHHFPHSSAK